VSEELAAPPGFPAPASQAVFCGLAGEIASLIAPHTEADPLALLAQLVVAAGVLIGRGAHVRVEASRHYPNEFVVLVGDSAKARKGSSFDHVARVLQRVDGGFPGHLRTGLSTGEGLIWAVRDANGADPGIADPRLLVVEPEFVSVLKATSRDLSTLSPVLRSAWDGRPLAILTRAAPATASAAHVGVIGHITSAELLAHTSSVQAANGFLNRFVFIACRRRRLLPLGGDPDPLAGSGLERRLGANLAAARRTGEIGFERRALSDWSDIYLALAANADDGLLGSLTARAEAHVLRLAMLYTLLDGEKAIAPCHLEAGFSLWNYAAASLRWAFSSLTADPVAEQIAAGLAGAPAGLTRTELRDLFGRNLPAARIDAALTTLSAEGRVSRQRVQTAGRPAELWLSHNGAPSS
jgi:hypothetical protein